MYRTNLAKERWRLCTLTGLLFLARQTECLNSLNTSSQLVILANQFWRNVHQPKTPSLAAVDEFFRADEGPNVRGKFRIVFKEFVLLKSVEG